MKKNNIIVLFFILLIFMLNIFSLLEIEEFSKSNFLEANQEEFQIVSNIKIAATNTNLSINPNDWKPNDTLNVTEATKLEGLGNKAIGIIRMIASIMSVVVLSVIGIKYMMGSIEEKAEYKKTMLPYVIGAILVFGITNVLGIIIDLISALV